METREAVFGRRSIRKYLDKHIELEVLQDILEGAIMAPSAVNNQPWYFLAIQSDEQMQKLRGIFKEVSEKSKAVLEERFPNNPEVISETLGFLTGLGDAKVCVLVFLLKPSADYDIIAVQSVSAAIENLCLMAYDKGIGSCWMTAPLTAGFGDILAREFAPGAGKFVAAVTLGYSAVTPQAPKRKQGRYNII
ncbi:MAG: nitroreductase [Firmicutes bacterium HGW-Firmicutes-15]|nr:MAG: nitroreductase [Firmicutes bacterium HGW-Firmicutes-15]